MWFSYQCILSTLIMYGIEVIKEKEWWQNLEQRTVELIPILFQFCPYFDYPEIEFIHLVNIDVITYYGKPVKDWMTLILFPGIFLIMVAMWNCWTNRLLCTLFTHAIEVF